MNNLELRHKLDTIVRVYGKEPSTLDEIAESVIAICNAATDNKVVGFKWDMRFGNVSNSHCSPVGKPQNWHGKPEIPTSYPGFSGRVWIRYDTSFGPNMWGSSPFANSLTYTGTGGYGTYDGPWQRILSNSYNKKLKGEQTYQVLAYSWDYRFFLEDFPLFESDIMQEQMMSELSGKKFSHPPHTFIWQDPATLEKDAEYMKDRTLANAMMT